MLFGPTDCAVAYMSYHYIGPANAYRLEEKVHAVVVTCSLSPPTPRINHSLSTSVAFPTDKLLTALVKYVVNSFFLFVMALFFTGAAVVKLV